MEPTWKRAMLAALRKKCKNKEDRMDIEKLFEDTTPEEIEFALRFVRTLSHQEAQLHDSDDPEEIAKGVMKAACAFYKADWCGFLNVDMELKLWKPYWWHNTSLDDRTDQMTEGFVSAEDLPRWARAMEENEDIVVPDVEEIQDTQPAEYAIYKRMYVKSLLAAPVKPRPVGFLVVRNPKRYESDARMLRMMAYVVLNAVNQDVERQRARMALTPDRIKSDTDIIVNFFGNMEVYTHQGVLRESSFNSPKCSELLTYLLLRPNQGNATQTIVETLWPEEEGTVESRCANLHSMMCKFRGIYRPLTERELIVTKNKLGYMVNPELNVMTDLQQFDALLEASRLAVDTSERVDLMEQAMEVYRGHVAASIQDSLWLKDIVHGYCTKYAGLVDELLDKLVENNDMYGVEKYTDKALKVMPEHLKARFWRLVAMSRNGLMSFVRSDLVLARDILTEEEFAELLSMIRQEPEFKNFDLSEYEFIA